MTTEEFKQKVFLKYGDKVEILGDYTGQNNRLNFIYHCDIHGDTNKSLNAKNITGITFAPCLQCANELKSKQAKLASRDPNFLYIRLKDYVESKGGKLISKEWTKAKDLYEVSCGNPNHPNFFSNADSLVNKPQWCPYCSGRKGNFQEEFNNIITNKNGTLLSNYTQAKTHLKVKCNIHNYIWDITPTNIKKGRWCPICNLPYSEKVLYDYLVNNNYNFKVQYYFDNLITDENELLRFDFAILNNDNNLNILIEVDDDEHRYNHKQLRRVIARQRDELKNNYCKNNNINLYRLEYKNKSEFFKDYDWYYSYINDNLKDLLKGESQVA